MCPLAQPGAASGPGPKDGTADGPLALPTRATLLTPALSQGTVPAVPPGGTDGQHQPSELAELAMPEAASYLEIASQSDPGRGTLPQAADRISRRGLAGGPWPLLAVLVVQGLLSVRLVWSNTAFQDEALYLRAGHLEWAHWLHHQPIPNFPAYFSGAPVIYPPLGALADGAGGLAAARLLSLCLMLAVTSLLWASTARLYGRRAALLATGLFATLAGTQFLGAFATYDSMALFLLALAAWLAVRSADCQSWARIALLLTAGVTLSAADAVKYATALFTPVVLVVAALAMWRRHGRTAGLMAGLTVLFSWLALVAAAIVAGGRDYWLGITTSTLARPAASIPAATILQRAYVWTSLIMVLAVLGAVLGARSEVHGKLLPSVLAAAGLLVPLEQARLHTTVSLQKHVVFGAWFAAIAAGYAMARLSRVDPGHGWAAVMALPIAASTLFGSMGQAAFLYGTWPNSAGIINLIRSAVHSHPGNYLAEGYDVEAYYLRTIVPWQRWSSTYYFSYPGARTQAASYKAAINRHYFSLVILTFEDTPATDGEITTDMRHAGGYYLLAHAGRFTIWASREVTPSPLPGRTHAGH